MKVQIEAEIEDRFIERIKRWLMIGFTINYVELVDADATITVLY